MKTKGQILLHHLRKLPNDQSGILGHLTRDQKQSIEDAMEEWGKKCITTVIGMINTFNYEEALKSV